MRRVLSIWLSLILLAGYSSAQFPYTSTIEVRLGQQRPKVSCIAMDAHSLLWTGSDRGVLRTDGERVDLMLDTRPAQVMALARAPQGMLAALSNGTVVMCNAIGCDTLLVDRLLQQYPVRAIVPADDGRIWLATYGAGLWSWHQGELSKWGMAQGLPDDHVNSAAPWKNGVIAATDQGLALCTAEGVVKVHDVTTGAPDNLVLSVATTAKGEVWAGTDRGGVFRWVPDDPVRNGGLPGSADHGGVVVLAVHGELIWCGTRRNGVVVHDIGPRGGRYVDHRSGTPGNMLVQDLLLDEDGAAWWCGGDEHVKRADPDLLFVPEHEGLDLRGITALCSDGNGRIWFATPQGLFHHARAFTEEQRVHRASLEVDPMTPIVSLAADELGSIWVATFGSGVYAIHRNGRIEHFTSRQVALNDNVLSVRCSAGSVWFGTLDGVSEYRDGVFRHHPTPGSGFIYAVLPDMDGGFWAATDGAGTWHGGAQPKDRTVGQGPRTFFSLVRDKAGRTWAAGPGTGLCRVDSSVSCSGSDLSAFTGDLFGLGLAGERIIAFGSRGSMAYDPENGSWTDLTARLGVQDLRAELNTICTDERGDLWFASDRGLLRFQPRPRHFMSQVPAVITAVRLGNALVDPEGVLRTGHDRNDFTFQFTGIDHADPAGLRFAYRLKGLDPRTLTTRDREVSYSALAPGRYTFQLVAFTGDEVPDNGWLSVELEVLPPWWRRTWVIITGLLLLAGGIWWIVRERDRRAQARARMEQEKVRFQLEALRSQVDPHFLFNSFNRLVDLIETDTDRAVEHVEKLSLFFRSILQLRDKELITLGEELRLLNTYFDLERERFGAAIDLRIEVPAEYHQHQVVPMTLQMLVENALKHNVIDAAAPLRLTIAVEGNALVVSNTVRPRATPPRSTGFGLESIRRRYAALTTRTMDVTHANEDFIVRIPLIEVKP